MDDIKSPTPIVMSFTNSTHNEGVYGTQNNHGWDKENVTTILKLLDAFHQQIINQNKLIELLLQKTTDN